jgi:hypothetical protein
MPTSISQKRYGSAPAKHTYVSSSNKYNNNKNMACSHPGQGQLSILSMLKPVFEILQRSDGTLETAGDEQAWPLQRSVSIIVKERQHIRESVLKVESRWTSHRIPEGGVPVDLTQPGSRKVESRWTSHRIPEGGVPVDLTQDPGRWSPGGPHTGSRRGFWCYDTHFFGRSRRQQDK